VEEILRGRSLCLDPAPFDKKPDLLRPFNPGYTFALKLWRWVSALLLLGGIIASFVWHWWAFIPGFLLSFMVHQMNSKSAGQFAAQAFKQHDDAAREFEKIGALFVVPTERIVGRR
jgi:hypothetical protein